MYTEKIIINPWPLNLGRSTVCFGSTSEAPQLCRVDIGRHGGDPPYPGLHSPEMQR